MSRREEKNEGESPLRANQLEHPFFEEGIFPNVDKEAVKIWNKELELRYFPYENAYYKQLNNTDQLFMPWKHIGDIQQDIWLEWEKTKSQLELFFADRRGQETVPLIKNGVSILISLLFWTNGKPVNLSNFPSNVEDLKVKPINFHERVAFILKRPFFYPSYVQLSELCSEMKKVTAKQLLVTGHTKKEFE